MNVTGCLHRVVTLRVYTLVFLMTVPFIVLSLIYWNNYANCEEFGIDNRVVAVPLATLTGKKKFLNFEKRKDDDKSRRTILYWTKMFRSDNFYFGKGDIFAGCPVWNCVGTNDRNYQPLDEFHAVMFHGPQLNANDLPKKRSFGQRYIFMDSETQVFHPIPKNPVFNNFFNWTMAYRRDADIMRPYGVFVNITSNRIIPPQIPAQWIDVSSGVVVESMRLSFKKKSKIAAWFVSHCSTNSKREEVARKLGKYVEIDVYGDCGHFHCPRTNKQQCHEKLESDYYFYLSFENSMCRDYITEKVFEILEYDVIPIVYGAADYNSFLPPNSYINVLDFKTIKELADFLVALSHDEERYLSYFKWKSFYKIVDKTKYIVCKFCEALHEPNSPGEILTDLYDWWIKESQCKSPPRIS